MIERSRKIKAAAFQEDRNSRQTWNGLHVDDYDLAGHVVRDVFAVLRLAQSIEPNPNRLMSWYQNSRIAELDSLTAEELVQRGRARDVLKFLTVIRNSPRH